MEKTSERNKKEREKEMPNHIKNIVKAKGLTKLPLFVKEDGVECFDFNRVIPMPKPLDVTAGSIEDLAIEAVIRKLSEKKSWIFDKERKRMLDQEWEDRVLSHENEEELLKTGLQYITNEVLYGATSWYEWCINNWGTKWNAYESEQFDADTIGFQTAWSNPEPIMLKLSEMYPDLIIEHWWADEGMGSNSGYRVYHGGDIVEGGYHDNFSNEAYENYVKCWGDSPCLCRNDDGSWERRDCEICHGCN